MFTFGKSTWIDGGLKGKHDLRGVGDKIEILLRILLQLLLQILNKYLDKSFYNYLDKYL